MRGVGEEYASIAHILRRTTFGPMPGAVERAYDEHGNADVVLEAAIAAEPVPFRPPAAIDDPFDTNDTTLINEELIGRWLDRMCSDDAGIHEKMMWFWHSHFTTSISKATAIYGWRQLRTYHAEALGNFHDLARQIVTSPAMLQYLDGDNTTADDPNENLARELMELYTMGRGHYTEEDVRSASRALAGWSVTPESNGAEQDPSDILKEPVAFLGKRAVFTADSVVDQIMEQQATAPFIVAKLAKYLIGDEVSPGSLDQWSRSFRSSGYEIAPIVAAMLRSDDFQASRFQRARNGIEWLCSVRRIVDDSDMEIWDVEPFAQIPFAPFNVAGWPDRWLSMSSLFARIAYLERLEIKDGLLDPDLPPASAALRRCGLFEVSEASRSAMEALASDGASHDQLLRAAMATPEFALS